MTDRLKYSASDWIWAATFSFFVVLCGLGIGFLLAGCTVTPQPVAVTVPAFSGNAANGGVIDLGPRDKGPAHVTAGWVQDYSALAKKYGASDFPPVKVGDGLTMLADGTALVDLQHLSIKNVYATEERSGIAP